MVQHRHHVFVARDDPGVHERIPHHRRFLAQPLVKRVRIGMHRRVEQLEEAEARVERRGGSDGDVVGHVGPQSAARA